jgi:hypothetical protein
MFVGPSTARVGCDFAIAKSPKASGLHWVVDARWNPESNCGSTRLD